MSQIQAYAVIGFLAVITTAIALLIWAVRKPAQPTNTIATEIIEATVRLGQEVQHHVEVNAVLALVEDFHNNPQLLANLSEYSQQVLGAALLLRVNALGNDIQVTAGCLSSARNDMAHGYYGADKRAARLSADLTELYEELDAANRAVRQLGGLRAV